MRQLTDWNRRDLAEIVSAEDLYLVQPPIVT